MGSRTKRGKKGPKRSPASRPRPRWPRSIPAQHQERQPGREHRMEPRPAAENPAYRAAGKLEGKVALITGGDSGIGRAVAVAFAKEGADVAILYLELARRLARDPSAVVRVGTTTQGKFADCTSTGTNAPSRAAPMPQKYVDDVVVPCVVDTFILANAQKGNVTTETVERDIRNLGLDVDIADLKLRERFENLERTGHLRREGNNYKLTDDGREDIQKVLPWFRTLNERVGTIAPGAGARGGTR